MAGGKLFGGKGGEGLPDFGEGGDGAAAKEDRVAGGMVELRASRVMVEAVVKGCLMTVEFPGGTNPGDVKGWLLGIDPGVVVRDEFPRKGGFEKRDSKAGKLMVVQVKAGNSGKFVDLVVQPAGEKPVSVGVGKAKVDGFLESVLGLGVLDGPGGDGLREVMEGGGVWMCGGGIEVVYFSSGEGKHYLEGVRKGD